MNTTALRNYILYGGLEKEVFQKNREHILDHDIRNLRLYFIIAGVGFALLGLVSFVTSAFAHVNYLIYFLTSLSYLMSYVLLRALSGRKGLSLRGRQFFIYLFMMITYLESIAITVQHSSLPSVTYIGVLLVLPLLFAQSPISISLFQSCFVFLFCICARIFKDPDIAVVDIWNGITFLMVSILTIMIIVPIRINQLIQLEVIRELSETDLLTGSKNRNSFEMNCRKIDASHRRPTCIYADVNGLHELNNQKGHEAGDSMLKTVASVLREAFGEEHMYRIGGDEFVAFSFGTPLAQCRGKLHEIGEKLEGFGYHVSFGSASPENQKEDIDAIIKRAEADMYDAKKEYYSATGKVRRN